MPLKFPGDNPERLRDLHRELFGYPENKTRRRNCFRIQEVLHDVFILPGEKKKKYIAVEFAVVFRIIETDCGRIEPNGQDIGFRVRHYNRNYVTNDITELYCIVKLAICSSVFHIFGCVENSKINRSVYKLERRWIFLWFFFFYINFPVLLYYNVVFDTFRFLI